MLELLLVDELPLTRDEDLLVLVALFPMLRLVPDRPLFEELPLLNLLPELPDVRLVRVLVLVWLLRLVLELTRPDLPLLTLEFLPDRLSLKFLLTRLLALPWS